MQEQDLAQLLGLEKRYYAKLSETMSITQELDEAIAHQDSVSIGLLISSRRKPLLELQEIQSYIDLQHIELSPQDAERMEQLVSGDDAQAPPERPVAEQIAVNRRLLERLITLDHRVNKNLCGSNSMYDTSETR